MNYYLISVVWQAKPFKRQGLSEEVRKKSLEAEKSGTTAVPGNAVWPLPDTTPGDFAAVTWAGEHLPHAGHVRGTCTWSLQPTGQVLATPNLRLLQVGKQSLKRLNNPPEFGSGSDSHYLRRNAAQEDLHKSQRTSSQSSLGVALGRDGTMGFAGGKCWGLCLPYSSSAFFFTLLFVCGDLHQGLGWPLSLQAVGPPLPGSHFWRLPGGGYCMIPMPPSISCFLSGSFNGKNQ